MTINEYQKLAMTTLNPDLNKKEVLINSVMGLCGESGEAATVLEVSLEDVLQANIDKLKKRYPDGFEKEKSLVRLKNCKQKNRGME